MLAPFACEQLQGGVHGQILLTMQVCLQVVWLQSGISDAHFEEQVAKAGIQVVPDRCLKVDRERARARL